MPAIPIASEMRRMAPFLDHHAARADDCAAALAIHGVRTRTFNSNEALSTMSKQDHMFINTRCFQAAVKAW